MIDKPIIGWFSCGATSAVACKIGLSMYQNVRIVHIETGSEHPDNIRFLKDCEEWYGCKIETIRSDKYSCVEDVLLRKKFINGPMGASCTKELKKRVRYSFEDVLGEWGGKFGGSISAKTKSTELSDSNNKTQKQSHYSLLSRRCLQNKIALEYYIK